MHGIPPISPVIPGCNSPLTRLVDTIENRYERGQYNEVLQIVEHNFIAVWFGLCTARLQEILEKLQLELGDIGFLATNVLAHLNSHKDSHLFDHETLLPAFKQNKRTTFILNLLRLYSLRTQGRPVEAMEYADSLHASIGTMQPVVDKGRGLNMTINVQIGITAMLAGDIEKALAHFTEAQLQAPVPTLPFLTRDALVKAAIIQASFGSDEIALTLIARSERIPRTHSWMEPFIDASREIAFILAGEYENDEGIARIDSLNLHEIGEMWPYYIVALHRSLVHKGQRAELSRRLEMLDAMSLPRIVGQGLSGSVIALKRAILALDSGLGRKALMLVGTADPNLHITKLIHAYAELHAGRAKQASIIASQAHKSTAGFRKLDMRRLTLICAAHQALGQETACLKALAQAMQYSGGVREHEALQFTPAVRRLGEKNFAKWPSIPESQPSTFLAQLPDRSQNLTERELQILILLSKGTSRQGIATELTTSINTVKTQMRSMYKKLNVKSAAEAIWEGQRRGII